MVSFATSRWCQRSFVVFDVTRTHLVVFVLRKNGCSGVICCPRLLSVLWCRPPRQPSATGLSRPCAVSTNRTSPSSAKQRAAGSPEGVCCFNNCRSLFSFMQELHRSCTLCLDQAHQIYGEPFFRVLVGRRKRSARRKIADNSQQTRGEFFPAAFDILRTSVRAPMSLAAVYVLS